MPLGLITTATTADAEAIATLVNEAYRPQSGLGGWTHESTLVSGNRINADQVAAAIKREHSIILVAVAGSRPAACVHVEKEGNTGHIGMLAVKPSAQRKGVGTRMLTAAERCAQETLGADRFVLSVLSAREELISFYLRRGYQRTNIRAGYPVAAGVGIPKRADLAVEFLEKLADNANSANSSS